MGPGDARRVPLALVRHGRARQTSELDHIGIVEGSCGNRARGVSIRGKIFLSRNMGYRTRGCAMLLNIALTPGKPTPKSNFRDWT